MARRPPGSAVWGAIGGSVLIESGFRQNSGWSGELGATAGSFGAYDGQGALGYSGPRVSTQIRVSGQWAENNFPFKNTAQIGQPQVRQVNNQLERWDVQQFNRLLINDKNVVRTAFWQQQAFREIPPTMTETAAETWQRDLATRAVATWEHRPNMRALWQSRAAFQSEGIYFRQFASTDSSRSRTALFSTEYTDRRGEKLTWKTGATALRQWARADGYTEKTRWYQQTRLAAFGMGERAWASGKISLLLRQEWAERQAAPFTWSLGSEWGLGRLGGLRAHLSRNFNLPTFNDRFWLALGQPDLRPEKGYSADLGWTLERKKVSAELTAFQLLIDDWILWQPGSDGQFRPGNLRKVWSRGLELASHVQGRGAQWLWKLSARGQFSATTNVAAYGGTLAVEGKQLPYTPRQSGSLSLRMQRGAFSGAYMHQFTGQRFSTTDNENVLPGFQTGQLLLSQTWTFRKTGIRAISLDLRIENIWNTPYQILAYRPMPGRSGRVGVRISW